ncbi:MAG: family 10 glycosylhydrolase [Phycisphaerales bacterium]
MFSEIKKISQFVTLLVFCLILPVKISEGGISDKTNEAISCETLDVDYAYRWNPDTYVIWEKKPDAPRQDVPITYSDWNLYRITEGKAGVRFVINNMAATGISHIWIRAFGGGWAEYKSQVDEVTKWTPYGSGEDAKKEDVLQESVEFGHELGLQVYAWFPFLEEWHGWKENSRSRYTDMHQDLSDQHLNGFKTGQPSFYFKEYIDYKLEIFKELINNYNIDGIVLDFERIAHRSNQCGYLPGLIDEFQSKTNLNARELSANDPNWMAFRAKYIGDFIKQVNEIIDQRNRPVELVMWNVWDVPLSAHWDVKTWTDAGLIKNLAVFKHGELGWGSAASVPDDLYASLNHKYKLNKLYYGCYAFKTNEKGLTDRAAAALTQGFDGLIWVESTPIYWGKRLNLPREFALTDTFEVKSGLTDMTGGGEIAVICSNAWDLSLDDSEKTLISGSPNEIVKIRLPAVDGTHSLVFKCHKLSGKNMFSGIAVDGYTITAQKDKFPLRTNPSWQSLNGNKVAITGKPGIAPFLGNK